MVKLELGAEQPGVQSLLYLALWGQGLKDPA